jgi:hypothetical protein
MKARGIGSHLRQVHGIVITKVVVNNSTRVDNNSTKVAHDSTRVNNNSTRANNNSTIVMRPSDYVRKKSEVLETRIEPIFRGPDSLGRYCCKNCGGWFVPETIPGGYNCLPGKKHEFLR